MIRPKEKHASVTSYIPKKKKKKMGQFVGKTFYSYLFIYLFISLTTEEKVNLELSCPLINQLKRDKTKY